MRWNYVNLIKISDFFKNFQFFKNFIHILMLTLNLTKLHDFINNLQNLVLIKEKEYGSDHLFVVILIFIIYSINLITQNMCWYIFI